MRWLRRRRPGPGRRRRVAGRSGVNGRVEGCRHVLPVEALRPGRGRDRACGRCGRRQPGVRRCHWSADPDRLDVGCRGRWGLRLHHRGLGSRVGLPDPPIVRGRPRDAHGRSRTLRVVAVRGRSGGLLPKVTTRGQPMRRRVRRDGIRSCPENRRMSGGARLGFQRFAELHEPTEEQL